jgi:nucleoside-diphosphate-sugar epimerase
MLMMQAQAGGTYNAGSGASVSVNDVATLIRDEAGTKKPIVARDEQRRNEIPDVVADITRVKATFGWEPQVSLRAGLKDLVNEEKIRLTR